jgi:hypothetical protein
VNRELRVVGAELAAAVLDGLRGSLTEEEWTELLSEAGRLAPPGTGAAEAIRTEEPLELESDQFDELLYALYKALVSVVGRERADHAALAVGEGILSRVAPVYPGRDDLQSVGGVLGQVMDFFVSAAYLQGAWLEWHEGSEKTWPETGTARFSYHMVDPVILPGAQKLHDEVGIAPHLSSRTMEAALKAMGIDGREVDFDPGEWGPDEVVETWELRLLRRSK